MKCPMLDSSNAVRVDNLHDSETSIIARRSSQKNKKIISSSKMNLKLFILIITAKADLTTWNRLGNDGKSLARFTFQKIKNDCLQHRKFGINFIDSRPSKLQISFSQYSKTISKTSDSRFLSKSTSQGSCIFCPSRSCFET